MKNKNDASKWVHFQEMPENPELKDSGLNSMTDKSKDWEPQKIDVNKDIEHGIKQAEKIRNDVIIVTSDDRLKRFRNKEFFNKAKKQNDRIFFENVTGYGFILMFLMILFAVNPLIVIIPATLFYTVQFFEYKKGEEIVIW